MGIMYYVMSAVLMGICFCIGVLTEKHFADKEIRMLRTRKMRPANNIHYYNVTVNENGKIKRKEIDAPIDFPATKKVR